MERRGRGAVVDTFYGPMTRTEWECGVTLTREQLEATRDLKPGEAWAAHLATAAVEYLETTGTPALMCGLAETHGPWLGLPRDLLSAWRRIFRGAEPNGGCE